MRMSGIQNSAARCCFALLLVVIFACAALAQSTTDGAIGGTVTDSSGAAVPNAKISVRNNGTNAEETMMTDDTGYFRVGKLQSGAYTVTVDAQGFAPFKAERVIVQVGSVTDISARLNVASAGATIVVSAEVPQVNTNSAEFAPTIDQNAISNLPINGGRWSSFALLTPGAVNDASGFGLISFRGMSTLLNNNTVDGGGTNQYHGEVYFYDRDNTWGAINPFTTLTDRTTLVTSPYKPVDVRKMYGFGVGGPIKKDKIFFFFVFDRYDRNFPGTAKATSPAAFFALPLQTLTTAYTIDGTTNCFQTNAKSNIN